jgi:hypothetical protein
LRKISKKEGKISKKKGKILGDMVEGLWFVEACVWNMEEGWRKWDGKELEMMAWMVNSIWVL